MVSDYLYGATKNIIRNKKNLIIISIFSLLFFLLFIDIIFIKNFYSYINYTINTNIAFRTFSADKDGTNFAKGSIELKKINHIADVYIAAYESFAVQTDFKSNGLDGFLEFGYGTENITPKSIIGKSIKDLKPGETICPIEFYPDSLTSDYKIDENKILFPEQTLNYEFDSYYIVNKFENGEIVKEKDMAVKKFKIVGLYDNKLVMNENNKCYITPQDMKVFHDNLNPHINYDKDDYIFVHVVVDKAKNLNKVKKEVKYLGYFVSEDTTMTFDEKTLNIMSLLAITFFFIIFGAIIFLFISYLNKKVKAEAKLLGILRSCGYTKKEILKKEIIEDMLIVFVCFIISCIIFSLIFSIVVKDYFEYTKYSGFYVTNSITLLTISFIIVTIILALIDYFIIKKNISISISNLLKEE